jgi:hypothetical protein
MRFLFILLSTLFFGSAFSQQQYFRLKLTILEVTESGKRPIDGVQITSTDDFQPQLDKGMGKYEISFPHKKVNDEVKLNFYKKGYSVVSTEKQKFPLPATGNIQILICKTATVSTFQLEYFRSEYGAFALINQAKILENKNYKKSKEKETESQTDNPRRVFNDAIDKSETITRLARASLDENKNSDDDFNKAVEYLKKGRLPEAMNSVNSYINKRKQLIKCTEEELKQENDSLINGLTFAADLSAIQMNIDSAIYYYSEAVKVDPKRLDNLYELINLLYINEYYEEAAFWLDQCSNVVLKTDNDRLKLILLDIHFKSTLPDVTPEFYLNEYEHVENLAITDNMLLAHFYAIMGLTSFYYENEPQFIDTYFFQKADSLCKSNVEYRAQFTHGIATLFDENRHYIDSNYHRYHHSYNQICDSLYKKSVTYYATVKEKGKWAYKIKLAALLFDYVSFRTNISDSITTESRSMINDAMNLLSEAIKLNFQPTVIEMISGILSNVSDKVSNALYDEMKMYSKLVGELSSHNNECSYNYLMAIISLETGRREGRRFNSQKEMNGYLNAIKYSKKCLANCEDIFLDKELSFLLDDLFSLYIGGIHNDSLENAFLVSNINYFSERNDAFRFNYILANLYKCYYSNLKYPHNKEHVLDSICFIIINYYDNCNLKDDNRFEDSYAAFEVITAKDDSYTSKEHFDNQAFIIQKAYDYYKGKVIRYPSSYNSEKFTHAAFEKIKIVTLQSNTVNGIKLFDSLFNHFNSLQSSFADYRLVSYDLLLNTMKDFWMVDSLEIKPWFERFNRRIAQYSLVRSKYKALITAKKQLEDYVEFRNNPKEIKTKDISRTP